MNALDFITPRAVERITHSDFCASFHDLLPRIESGTVFLVTGNPALQQIIEDFVEPTKQRGTFKDFRQDSPALYDKQLVQRAMIEGLPLPSTALLDSTLRLRRTVGMGAFVGPHVDVQENLPLDGLNFWISFSHLEKDEAIQFLPAAWILDGTPVGHFKAGVYRSESGKILPVSDLEKSAVSAAIAPGEYFAFYSGRTPHCSPFFVKGERITADQRIILNPTPELLKFGSRSKYYPASRIDEFDGSRSVAGITEKFWANEGQSMIHESTDRISEMRSNLNAASEVAKIYNIGADATGVSEILDAAKRSVALRLSLLPNTKTAISRQRVAIDLIQLTPENPAKTYPPAINAAFSQILPVIWRTGLRKNGIAAAIVSIALAASIRAIQFLGAAIPQRISIVLSNKLCWLLWERLNGTGQIEQVRTA